MITLFQALLLISVFFLHVAPPAIIYWPSFPYTVDGIDFYFFNSETNRIIGPCQVEISLDINC